ncbi:hypothetical protein HDV05_004067 [Chytridiales sp. JEL 0842]|nr:hypothetical protein HDV05_004067 [Chytridiales sp. JEL 0842]
MVTSTPSPPAPVLQALRPNRDLKAFKKSKSGGTLHFDAAAKDRTLGTSTTKTTLGKPTGGGDVPSTPFKNQTTDSGDSPLPTKTPPPPTPPLTKDEIQEPLTQPPISKSPQSKPDPSTSLEVVEDHGYTDSGTSARGSARGGRGGVGRSRMSRGSTNAAEGGGGGGGDEGGSQEPQRQDEDGTGNGGDGEGDGGEGGDEGASGGRGRKGVVKVSLDRPLTIINASVDTDLAVVGGRDVLKVFHVGEKELKEVVNLRAGVKAGSFSLTDAKWANGFAPRTIASSYSNGDIIIWDLNRGTQKQENVITEHYRAVNRLSFHKTEPGLLLSACQDGTVKMWDLRTKGAAKATFDGKAENVRDVQFSPTSPYEFIAAFENGNIQKWDIRRPSEAERRWSAHFGLALTVDWHPDGRHVASAGRDRVVKVWDTKSDSRKPTHTIQTISHLARIAWRPLPSPPATTDQTVPPLLNQQIASCSLINDSRALVWDLARPFVPFLAAEEHEEPITDFLWASENVIWSVSKDQSFVRLDVNVAGYHPAEYMNSGTCGWNVFGDLMVGGVIGVGKNSAADEEAKLVASPPPNIEPDPYNIPDPRRSTSFPPALSSVNTPTPPLAQSSVLLPTSVPVSTSSSTLNLAASMSSVGSGNPATSTTVPSALRRVTSTPPPLPPRAELQGGVSGGSNNQTGGYVASQPGTTGEGWTTSATSSASLEKGSGGLGLSGSQQGAYPLINTLSTSAGARYGSQVPPLSVMQGLMMYPHVNGPVFSAASGQVVGGGVPEQIVGLVETGTFDHVAFQVLAQKYEIGSGGACSYFSKVKRKNGKEEGGKFGGFDTVEELQQELWGVCEKNAEAALSVQFHRTAQTWRFLQVLLCSGLLESAAALETTEVAVAPQSKPQSMKVEKKDASLETRPRSQTNLSDRNTAFISTSLTSDASVSVASASDAEPVDLGASSSFGRNSYVQANTSTTPTTPAMPHQPQLDSRNVPSGYFAKTSRRRERLSGGGGADSRLMTSGVTAVGGRLVGLSLGGNSKSGSTSGLSGLSGLGGVVAGILGRVGPGVGEAVGSSSSSSSGSSDETGMDEGDHFERRRSNSSSRHSKKGSQGAGDLKSGNLGTNSTEDEDDDDDETEFRIRRDVLRNVGYGRPIRYRPGSVGSSENSRSYLGRDGMQRLRGLDYGELEEDDDDDDDDEGDATGGGDDDDDDIAEEAEYAEYIEDDDQEDAGVDVEFVYETPEAGQSAKTGVSTSSGGEESWKHRSKMTKIGKSTRRPKAKPSSWSNYESKSNFAGRNRRSGKKQKNEWSPSHDVYLSQEGNTEVTTYGGHSDQRNLHLQPLLDVKLLLKDLFDFYADQGNIQMCVTMALVFRGVDGLLDVVTDKDSLELWFWSYIDLLHRFELWTVATHILLESGIPSVQGRNQESTTIHTSCGNCGKGIPTTTLTGWMCDRCKELIPPCAFCHKIVKGTYVWCQGCLHGGHLDCISGNLCIFLLWFEGPILIDLNV